MVKEMADRKMDGYELWQELKSNSAHWGPTGLLQCSSVITSSISTLTNTDNSVLSVDLVECLLPAFQTLLMEYTERNQDSKEK